MSRLQDAIRPQLDTIINGKEKLISLTTQRDNEKLELKKPDGNPALRLSEIQDFNDQKEQIQSLESQIKLLEGQIKGAKKQIFELLKDFEGKDIIVNYKSENRTIMVQRIGDELYQEKCDYKVKYNGEFL